MLLQAPAILGFNLSRRVSLIASGDSGLVLGEELRRTRLGDRFHRFARAATGRTSRG